MLPGRACPSRPCPTADLQTDQEDLTPSPIGVILSDPRGVAKVCFVTVNKILRILKCKGLAPDLPDDL